MPWKAASSLEDGAWLSSGREPSTMASSSWVAICRKIGPPSSFTPPRRTREEPGGSLVHYSRNEPVEPPGSGPQAPRGSARGGVLLAAPGLLRPRLAGEDQV